MTHSVMVEKEKQTQLIVDLECHTKRIMELNCIEYLKNIMSDVDRYMREIESRKAQLDGLDRRHLALKYDLGKAMVN